MFTISTAPARWCRSVRASPGRSLRHAANCFALGSAAFVLRFTALADADATTAATAAAAAATPDHLSTAALARDVVDLASASLYTLGSTLWLHQTVLRERLRGSTLSPAGVADSMDEQSDAGWSQPPTWNEIAELVSGKPVVCSVVLFLCGCALDDALSLSDVIVEEVATRARGGLATVPWFDPLRPAQPARISFERVLPFAPGVVAAVAFGVGGAARLVRLVRGDGDSFDTRDEADMWLPCERDDECASMVPPPEVTERLDARIANVARFAQWPLNLLASFAFIDGAWLGEFGAWSKLAGAQPATGNVLASVGSDVVNVASSLSESAARLASENYVVGNSLADLGSIRDDLFGSGNGSPGDATAADGLATGAHGALSSSDAAHALGGGLFLVSSVAWIVELRARRRLRCARRGDDGDGDGDA